MTYGEAEFDDVSQEGFLARIAGFDDARTTVYFQRRHGTWAWATAVDQELQGGVGDVILVTGNSYHVVSKDLWEEDTIVGVVRLKHDDVTVLDVGNRLETVAANPDLEFEVDNTVEATQLRGVVRILDKEPLSPLDRGGVGDGILTRVKQTDFTDADSLDSIGGLAEIIREARNVVLLPITEPERFKALGGNPIKGVLFTGPPGVGKTMLARALAREAKAAFYNIRGPELSSMWVGESERTLRRIFEDAGREPRALIFFDEFDSIGGQRNERTHEASRHLVAQLLTLMDGFTQFKNVMVLAATNRVGDIDSALRRPGRFDWEIVFPYPNAVERRDILVKSSTGLSVADGLPYDEIATITEGWTGADLAAIWRECRILAASERRQMVTAEDLFIGYERTAAHRAHRLPLEVAR